jgi:hypothetical protein
LPDRAELGFELVDGKIHMRSDLARSRDRVEQVQGRLQVSNSLGKKQVSIIWQVIHSAPRLNLNINEQKQG